MHKHAKMINELTKEFGGQRPLAEAIGNVAKKNVTFKMVSNWKNDGVPWRFRGAVKELTIKNGTRTPVNFHLHD